MATIQQRLALALEAHGFRRDVNARTGKYLVYRHPNEFANLYLGYGGALRRGKTATESYPVDKLKASLLDGTYVRPEVRSILASLVTD